MGCFSAGKRFANANVIFLSSRCSRGPNLRREMLYERRPDISSSSGYVGFGV